jgi:hypothetical protein
MFAGRYENASDERVKISAPMRNMEKRDLCFPGRSKKISQKTTARLSQRAKMYGDILQDFHHQDPFWKKHDGCSWRRIKTVRPGGIHGHGKKRSSLL